jgi:hypothetical protein
MMNHDDHDGDRMGNGPEHHMGGHHHHCWTTWRHHHRVRTCS